MFVAFIYLYNRGRGRPRAGTREKMMLLLYYIYEERMSQARAGRREKTVLLWYDIYLYNGGKGQAEGSRNRKMEDPILNLCFIGI